MTRQRFCVVISLALLFLAIQTSALAQKAKVGDRVEDVSMYSEKGTIEEVGSGEYEGCYRVLFDFDKGKGKKPGWTCTYGQQNRLIILDANGKRLRDVNAVTATAPVTAATGTQTTAAQGTPAGAQTEKPALCGGELLLDPKLKGKAASPALFKDVIKSLWDKDKDNKGWGRRVARVDSLTVGAAYRWRPGIDFQSLGTKPKTVYPVKAKYTTCEEQMLEFRVTETTNEEIYSCYVEDEFGNWTCAIRTAAEFKKTYFDKPEKKKITGF